MKRCPTCAAPLVDLASMCVSCGTVVVVIDSDASHWLDSGAQPAPAFNAKRRADRAVSELLGLAKGMLADGVVNDREAEYLRDWGRNHPDVLGQWPLSIIFSRLQRHFVDGRVDDIERVELQTMLEALVGGRESVLLGYEGATTLPLDQPPPLVCYGPDEVFVFTGRFAYGPRYICEQEVSSRGSSCEGNVTRRTTFMVVDTFGSRDWAHSSFGRKIERARELRDSGFALRIVGEDHWATSLSLGV